MASNAFKREDSIPEVNDDGKVAAKKQQSPLRLAPSSPSRTAGSKTLESLILLLLTATFSGCMPNVYLPPDLPPFTLHDDNSHPAATVVAPVRQSVLANIGRNAIKSGGEGGNRTRV